MGFLGFHTKPAPLLNQNYTVSPERKSNILSQLTFAWVYPFLKIGYSRPLQLTDLWRLEDERLSCYQSNLLEHNFYEKYVHVDAAFRKPQPDEDSTQAERSGSIEVAIDGKEETSKPDPNKEELEAAATQTLQPMVSRADLPGANVNPKAASVRQAEKTFVPSTNRWTWMLPVSLKKKDTSDSMLAEKQEKVAVRSHSIHPLELFDRPNSIFRSMCDAAKLTREAIIRIRAGENARNVEGEMETGMQPESNAVEKIQDEPYTLGDTARKADQADEIVAVVPTEDHATDKQKD